VLYITHIHTTNVQQDAASIDEGEEVTLLRWTSVLVTSARRSHGDGSVVSLESEYLPVFKFLKKKKAVTWLANCADLVPLKLLQVTINNSTYHCYVYKLLCYAIILYSMLFELHCVLASVELCTYRLSIILHFASDSLLFQLHLILTILKHITVWSTADKVKCVRGGVCTIIL
jgi:uncharacterized membrane protein YdbT with pleckstrin-like domain